MNKLALIGSVAGFAAGLFIGYKQRPASLDSSVRPSQTREEAGIKRPDSPAALPSTAAAQPAIEKTPAKQRLFADCLSDKGRSSRLIGLLELIQQAEGAPLEELTKDILLALKSGKLSPGDLAVLVEVLGEKGNPAIVAILLKNPAMGRRFAETMSLYFASWTRNNSAAAWSFAENRYKNSEGGAIPDAILKGLIQGTPDENTPQMLAMRNGMQPGKFIRWRTEAMVREAGFDGAIDKVKKGISDKKSEEYAMDQVGGISLVALDSGSEAIHHTAKLLMDAGPVEHAAHQIIKGYAIRDTEEAYEWAKSLPPGTGRGMALSAAVFETGLRDADKAIEWVKNLPAGDTEQQLNLGCALNDSFRQNLRLTDAEREELLQQTGPLIEKLRPKRTPK